ncbi:MAG: hypothetical protein EBX95_07150 [Acidimicrobiia bacterium]|nr:hypothetical protein [Acidimicrobiia bacterium]
MANIITAYTTRPTRTTKGAIRVARRGGRAPFGGFMIDWLITSRGIGPTFASLEKFLPIWCLNWGNAHFDPS